MDTPVFGAAAVAAPHGSAAEAGRAALEAGANAVEAMVAMAAVIAVVYPHMNSLGGDGFWLVREPSGRVRYIEACGCAAERATIAAYRNFGHETVPARGPAAILTAPGAVAGWSMALDLSRALGGRLPLVDLLAPAVQAAREGYAVSPSEARCQVHEKPALLEAPGFAEAFLVEGRWPRRGEIRAAPALAATIGQLAHAGLDDFYRGDVGRELAGDLERIGSPIGRSDLERSRARLLEPLSLFLSTGVALYNSPPPTQGLASLLTLGLFERLGVRRGEGFEHIHGLIEAVKRAIAVRDRVCVEPLRPAAAPAHYLSQRWLAREADAIEMGRAARFPLAEDKGDTVWMGAADSSGLVVSYIQSIYWEYGSGCVLPRTGVLMQNRGRSFSLDPTSPNALAPGARPFHTLSPALALYPNGDALAYGSMGGDGQPQFQAQIFTRRAFGAGLMDAVDAPRFLLGRAWADDSTTLKLESRFDSSLIAALERAGHAPEILPEAYSDLCGHAGAVLWRRRGGIEAAHDPRADGGATGL